MKSMVVSRQSSVVSLRVGALAAALMTTGCRTEQAETIWLGQLAMQDEVAWPVWGPPEYAGDVVGSRVRGRTIAPDVRPPRHKPPTPIEDDYDFIDWDRNSGSNGGCRYVDGAP